MLVVDSHPAAMFSSTRSALVFLLLGPAVGSLPFVVAVGIAGVHDTTGPLGGLLLIVLAYPFGFVPAALACAGFVLLSSLPPLASTRTNRKRGAALGAAVGMAATIAFVAVIDAFARSRYPVVYAVVAVPGGLAGLVCGSWSVSRQAAKPRIRDCPPARVRRGAPGALK